MEVVDDDEVVDDGEGVDDGEVKGARRGWG